MKYTEREFLQAVKRADRRYFAEVTERIAAHRAEVSVRKGRHLMKKIGKFAIGAVVTAALLTAGGIAAMVAMRGSEGGNNKSSEVTKESILGPLTLTDQQWRDIFCGFANYYYSGNAWFTAAEGGFYQQQVYKCHIEYAEDGTYDWQGYLEWADNLPANHAILYTDAETGEHTILCNRANCLHDGSDFCPATTKGYEHENLIYYDNYLYTAAAKRNSKGEYEAGYVLRYECDGSGITEVAHFNVHPQAEFSQMVLHRGWLWVVYQDYSFVGETMQDGITQQDTQVKTGGYVICGYELASGRTVELERQMAKKTGQVYNLPGTLYADGDYLVYVNANRWPRAHTGNAVAIDLRTQQAEDLRLGGSGIYFQVLRNNILYYREIFPDGDSEHYKPVYHRLNLETHEETSTETKVETQYTDGEYFYDTDFMGGAETAGPLEYRFWSVLNVYDSAGDHLQSIDLPENERYYLVQCYQGDLYLMRVNKTLRSEATDEERERGRTYHEEYEDFYELLRCSREDLINGRWNPQKVLSACTAEATCSLEDQKRYSGQ